MKDLFRAYKKNIFLITYTIVAFAFIMNYKVVIDTGLFILGLFEPLFLALAIAFVLNIPMRSIEKQLYKIIKKDSVFSQFVRTIAMILTLILTLVALFFVFMFIVPTIAEKTVDIFMNFNVLIDSTITSVNEIFYDININFEINDISFIKSLQSQNWGEVFSQSQEALGGFANGVITNVVSFTGAFFEWFLAFCLSLYLLAGKEKMQRQIRKFVLAFCSLETSEKIFHLGTRANSVFTIFVGGQLVECLVKGGMFYVVSLFLGFPLPEVTSAIIILFSIVPVFGPTLACVVCAVLIFAYDPIQAFWFVIVFQIISNFEGQVIYPKIVGKAIGLPGVWVLLSIFLLGSMYGIPGMLLAVPITTLVYEYMSVFINKRIRKKKFEMYVEKKVTPDIKDEQNEK
ncbi:MAG: AI-2E family transporter [Breznakia sp.]